MKKLFRIAAFCLLLLSSIAVSPRPVAAATPDPVLEWIGVMNNTVIAGGSNSIVTTRVAAMVSASVFDAVNGIDPRFQSVHVKPGAPQDASRRAAAIQAAYVILLHSYPAQSAGLTAQRNASLAALALTEQGTNSCGRYLGLEADRRKRAPAATVCRRAWYRGNPGCGGRLAANTSV
ncbi:MAG TPA: hypothetical protein VF863_09450 [Candidatus Acidoferrum sp.]